VHDRPSTTFGSLTVSYDPQGLRPRPWTELQSLWAAELLGSLPDGDVLELCAGPGQIGLLALATSGPTAGATGRRLVQVDEDTTACELAVVNARRAGLADRVEVRHGPAEGTVDDGERFVLVLADPPWVASADVHRFPDDPPSAIDGGRDGLDVVRALLPVCERHLEQAGVVLLQVGGPEQVDGVRDVLRRQRSTLRVADWRQAPAGERGSVVLLTRS
jgi:release factor glutamine methyltransferase